MWLGAPLNQRMKFVLVRRILLGFHTNIGSWILA